MATCIVARASIIITLIVQCVVIAIIATTAIYRTLKPLGLIGTAAVLAVRARIANSVRTKNTTLPSAAVRTIHVRRLTAVVAAPTSKTAMPFETTEDGLPLNAVVSSLVSQRLAQRRPGLDQCSFNTRTVITTFILGARQSGHSVARSP